MSGEKDDITPEGLAELEKKAKAADIEIEKLLKKKPAWMIDEHSSVGEILEFEAVTMPFKWQQMIEISEKLANDTFELAKIFGHDPEKKERYLKHAEDWRKRAADMRERNWLIRAGAEEAAGELEGLT